MKHKERQNELMKEEKRLFERRAGNQTEIIRKGCYKPINKYLPSAGCLRSE